MSTRRLRAAAGVVLLALSSLITTAGPGPSPAGAATATLRSLRTIDHQFVTRARSTGTTERYSSPALGDLNGDDKPDLVVAAPNGTVRATRLDTGATMWTTSLGATEIHATPIIDDLDGGGMDVVVATMDGRVVLLNGQNGSVKRTYRQGAPLNCPPGVDCRPDGFFATPAIGDVNGDGHKDIIAPSFDHTVYAWSVGGTLLWRAFLYDTLWSSPAIVDLDRNGRKEVVLGGDIYAGNPLGVPQGGLVWALNGSNGTRVGGYPKSIPGEVVWSSPAIGDIDGDGRLDAVVGTGTMFGDGAASRRVWAFTLTTRANLPGWPVQARGRVAHQPAIADVDGDGADEVVVNTETGYLSVYEPNGSERWATCNANSRTSGCGGPTSHSGVVVADVDDDGVQEVVATSGLWLRVYDGRNKTLEAEYRIGSAYNQYIHPASVPAISELDGKTIIVQSAFYKPRAQSGDVIGGDYVRTVVVTTDQPLCAQDWPAFKRNHRRDSLTPSRPPWSPFACARPFVTQQYRDMLGRGIDAAGLEYWTARLRTTWSGPRVVEGFMDSLEFRGVAAPVVRLHMGVDPAPPGPARDIRAEMVALRQGTDLAAIADDLLAARPPRTDGQLVDEVYPRLVGRAANATERTNALNRIGAVGQATWLAELSESTAVVNRLRDRVQVVMTYIGLLDRAPDAAGLAFWIDQVERGVSPQRLIEQFLNTPEYRNRVL